MIPEVHINFSFNRSWVTNKHIKYQCLLAALNLQNLFSQHIPDSLIYYLKSKQIGRPMSTLRLNYNKLLEFLYNLFKRYFISCLVLTWETKWTKTAKTKIK